MHNTLIWYRINSTGRRGCQWDVGASVVTQWFLFLCQESDAEASQGHVKDSGNVVTPGDRRNWPVGGTNQLRDVSTLIPKAEALTKDSHVFSDLAHFFPKRYKMSV